MWAAVARDCADAVLFVGELEMSYSCHCGRGCGVVVLYTSITYTPGVCPLVDNYFSCTEH